MVKRTQRRKWLIRVLFWLPLAFVLLTAGQVLVLKWVNPVATGFMFNRQLSAWQEKDWHYRTDYRWQPMEQISTRLPLAVVAAEDQRFPLHNGFDLAAIEKAYQHNQRGKKVRGASTISQQLAKNLFLWSGRSFVRKGLEAWYTVLIETFWSKRRILEVYVNVVEFGDGIYGAEAAAHRFFGVSAKQLTSAQSARLAAVLPSPRRYNAAKPGPYVQRRSRNIERQMRNLGGPAYLQACCAP